MAKREIFKKFFLILVLFIASVSSMGVDYTPPGINGFHPLYEDVKIISPLQETHPSFLNVESNLFKDTTIVDFEKRSVTFVRFDKHLGVPIWTFHYPELNEYLDGMFRFSVASSWKDDSKEKEKKDDKKGKDLKLEFALPVHYPAWARRILGKEPPKLSIKGFQSITIKYDDVREKIQGVEQENENSGDFQFDWANEFKIKGSIGRLISVELTMAKAENEDGGMSIENQDDFLKIQYKADPDSANQLEDEIIQEIVAGKTTFEMPGQGLAGFAGKRDGLMGIKIRSQWGPLSLTTVVSQEKSESQEKVIEPNKTTTDPNNFDEKMYLKYYRYFLDSTYKNLYLNKADSVSHVEKLKVYKSVNLNYSSNDHFFVWAKHGRYAYGDTSDYKLFIELKKGDDYDLDSINGHITFKDIRLNRDDVVAIYIQKKDGTILGSLPSGTKSYKAKSLPASDYLWTLKYKYDEEAEPGDPYYGLMWRNIYPLPDNATSAGFDIKIERKGEGGNKAEEKQGSRYYSEILQVADAEGKALVSNSDIYDFANSIIIFPPFKTGEMNGEKSVLNDWPFTNSALGKYYGNDNVNSFIYNDSAFSTVASIFQMKTSGTISTKSTTFSIAFGILDGTEELKADGKVLEKDVDYIIDYEFGSVTLISDYAQSLDKITVKYQQASLFNFDSKQFLGAYGRLDFPNIGSNSFLATSFMGQFTSANSNIPKVGLENYNRFLMDYNLHLEFEPEWMTNFVNFIPLVSTTATSSATIDLEVAYSALKSDKDNQNQAYIEDFKSVQQDAGLTSSHESWYQSSPSPDWFDDPGEFIQHPKAWKTYWFSPLKNDNGEDAFKVNKEELFDLTTSEKQTGDKYYLSTLRLAVKGVPGEGQLLDGITDSSAEKGSQIVVDPWTGIMKPIYIKDKRQDKYFEFWIRSDKSKGKIFVDMGSVSEDLSFYGIEPMGGINEEGAGRESYDSVFNIGLDLLHDTAEVLYYPSYNSASKTFSYDTLKYGDENLLEYQYDPSKDNYAKYTVDKYENRDKTNGLERDSAYNSEDLNKDGFKKTDDFYRVEIDLEDVQACPYFDTEKTYNSKDKGQRWYFFRIPINAEQDTSEIKQFNSPSWDKIEYVRLLWSGFKTDDDKKNPHFIDFYDMKFTKNKWREILNEENEDASIDATVLNTEADNGYYKIPDTKEKYLKDKNNKNNLETDYALRINYENVRRGETVLVEKVLQDFQKVDISEYKEVRLWAKENISEIRQNEDGVNILEMNKKIVSYYDPYSKNYIPDTIETDLKDPAACYPQSDIIRFVFRFGNSDSSYYEFSRTFGEVQSNGVITYDGASKRQFWDSEEGMNFNIAKIVSLKEAYINTHGFLLSSIDTSEILDDGSEIKVFSTTGVLPSVSNITWMAFGVKRVEDALGLASGEIWLNGLRIFGIRDVKGWAFRAKLDTKWADFMSASASLDYDEADFRQMSEQANDTKDSRVASDINSQLHFDKFMPAKWGVKMPVSAHVGASLTRPRQVNGSDIFLTDENGEGDRFGDMIGDFTDLIFKSDVNDDVTDAEHYEKNSVNRSWRTSFSKNSKSKTTLGRLTLDRMQVSYNYVEDSSTTKEGLISIDEKEYIEPDNLGPDHVDIRSTRKHSSALKYDLSPKGRIKWASWKPFKKKRKLPHHLKKYEFNLLPKTLSFDIAEANYSKGFSYRSINDVQSDSSVYSNTENLSMNHRLRASYAPFDPLFKATYNLDVNRDFTNSFKEWGDRENEGSSPGDGMAFFGKKVWSREQEWKEYNILNDESGRKQDVTFDFAPQFFSWLTHSATYSSNYNHNPISDTATTKLNATLTSSFDVNADLRLSKIFRTLSDKSEKAEKFSKVVSRIESGLNKLDLTYLRFSYGGRLQLTNNNMSVEYFDSTLNTSGSKSLDFMKYKLGLKERDLKDVITGNIDDDKAFGAPRDRKNSGKYEIDEYRNDRRVTTQDYKFSTRMRLPKPLYLNFTNISLGWKRTYTVKPENDYMDSTISFPDFSTRMTSKVLEEIPIVKQKMKNLSLSSSYSFSKNEKKSYKEYSEVEDSILIAKTVSRKHSFRPLFKIDGVLKKKPVNLNYEFGFAIDSVRNPVTNYDDVEQGDSSTAFTSQKDFSHKWNVSYTVKGKKERSILLFKKWNINLTGEMRINLDINYDKVYRNSLEIQEEKELDKELGLDYGEDKGDYEFKFNPSIKYNFTKNIEGTLLYTLSKSRNSQVEREKEVRHHIFELTIKIFFK